MSEQELVHRDDSLADRCLRFVEDQSSGEWGGEIEASDAAKLELFVLREIARAQVQS